MFAVCFEAPLLYLRDLGALLWASTLSIACSIFFSLALTAVAVVAACQGKLATFFIGPDPKLTGTSIAEIAVNWIAVVPVIALAEICHFNLLPIVRMGEGIADTRLIAPHQPQKASLIDKRPHVMHSVISIGTLLITIIYSVVAVSGYTLFGRCVLS